MTRHPISSLPGPLAMALLALGLGSSVAAAQPRKVLVLPFEGDLGESAPDDGLAQLTAVVARSAGITGSQVSIGQASFTDTATLVGCATQDASCLGQVAASLKVDQVVTGAVRAAEDGSTVTVELRFYKDGEVAEQTLELAAPSFEAVLAGLARDVPALFVSAPRATQETSTRTTDPGTETAPPGGEKSPERTPPAEALTPPPPPRDTGGADSGGVGLAAWIVTGAGVAVGGAGGVFLYMARDRQEQVDDAPVGTAADFERLEQLEDEGEQYTRIGNALLIGGGAALLVGGTLIAIQSLSGGGAEPAAVSVAPVPLPGGAGINVTLGRL